MSFIQRLFGFPGESNEPDIPFGRYTDAYKNPDQLNEWEKSIELFEQGRVMQSYRAFLKYLLDEPQQNISWSDQGNEIQFEFQQGSRLVTGLFSSDRVVVESQIARAEDLNVGFLRRLMEYNYTLKFCRFSLSPDNCLCIVFDSATTDGSPLKLLHAFRELSITADKQDDLLLDEFKSLQPLGSDLQIELSEKEKEAKYQFIQDSIKAVFEEWEKGKPDPNQFPGGYAYLWLSLAFRLDYLTKPEGFMMDVLERIHRTYFAKDERNVQHKLQAIQREYQKLLDRPKEDFFKEMYRTKGTFGINPPVTMDRIKALIEGELPNIEWHLNQNHETLAQAVPKYIVGYALFHFVPPKPVRDLFHLFFRITEPAFFRELGFTVAEVGPDGSLDRRALSRSFKRIIDFNKKEYPRFKPNASRLDYSDLAKFGKTYLEMIKEIDLSKVE